MELDEEKAECIMAEVNKQIQEMCKRNLEDMKLRVPGTKGEVESLGAAVPANKVAKKASPAQLKKS